MKLTARQLVYIGLTIIGLVATWYFNIKFTMECGGVFSISKFLAGAYANSASSSISNDLSVAVIVFLVWSYSEAKRVRMRHWWIFPVVTFLIAFACAFPLFLLFRERRLQIITDSHGE